MYSPAVNDDRLKDPGAVLSHARHKVKEVRAVIGHPVVGPGEVLHLMDVVALSPLLTPHPVLHPPLNTPTSILLPIRFTVTITRTLKKCIIITFKLCKL